MKIRRYLSSCFLLLIPIILWNVFLVDYLPIGYTSPTFDKAIPKVFVYGETLLRPVLFALPIVMKIELRTKTQKIGSILYLIGTLVYFASWLVLILYPESTWSNSAVGFSAPAYTTFIFFIGIGLIGQTSFFNFPPLNRIYIGLSLLFVGTHAGHVLIAFSHI